MKIRFLGIFFVVLMSVGGYTVVCVRHFYATPSPTFVLSPFSQISMLSADCAKRLKVFFSAYKKTQVSSADFSAALKKEFPVLKKITFAYKHAKKTVVTVQGAQPVLVFNNQVAFTDQTTHVRQSDFDPSLLATLPHFSVAPSQNGYSFSPECIRYAYELDPAVHALYDVEWIDSSLIKFHHKKHAQIMVLGSVDTTAETILEPACGEIIAVLLERKPSRKKEKYDWCIDRRFKGQMIVFPGGRVTHEKTVCG
jgi:hypothetical protein